MLSSNVDAPEDSESNNLNLEINDANLDNSHVENNTNTRTEPSSEPRNQNFSKTLYKKMYVLCRELCFLLLLVLTYASFQNNTPKVSKSPAAFPFFPPGSIVKDWYQGQLSEAINQASKSDLAFVMYYAPWDAESQAVRYEFNIVSQHMHKYIHFAAINCWQPGSECRLQYSKVYSWPVLMAYPAHGRGIQYRGPRKAEHMLKFLQSVSQPFIRISSSLELNTYRPYYDAVVVGYVDAKLGSSDYGVLYSTALRFLERDPLREIQFVVVTGTSYSLYDHMEINLPALQLVMWNETLQYPADREWRPEVIISWITERLHQVSVWASPAGGKSQSLAPYLQPGPALILFTPRNPLYDMVDYYTVLHEVAMEYYNCDKNIAISLQKMMLRTIQGTPSDDYVKHEELMKKCSIGQVKKKKLPPVITYDLPKVWLNNTCSITRNELDMTVCSDITSTDKNKCDKVVRLYPTKLRKESYRENINDNQTDNKIKKDVRWTTMSIGEGDPRSPANLLQLAVAEKCRYAQIAHHLQPALFTTRTPFNLDEFNDNVTGMACKTNMSLSLLALDSLQNHHFAEGLGIDILSRKDKTAVVIINPKFETHHVMMEKFNTTNLRIFIRNFANGVLDRILSSTEITRSRTHHYKSQNFSKFNSQHTCIKELTTNTFLPTVMKQDKAVIILYHSVKCAFCSGVSHTLLAVARLLTTVSHLQFARIDGDDHALPWEFAMHYYPSILFFPARRKSESRAFPQNVPITIPNLISFILANVEPEMRLHIIWTLCRQTKYEQDLQTCGRTLRMESSSLIGRMLREYRSSIDLQRRGTVFSRLQQLRSLQFLFTSPLKLHVNIIQKHMTNLYSNYFVEPNTVLSDSL